MRFVPTLILAALLSVLLWATALAQDIREDLKAPPPKLTRAPVLRRFVKARFPREARRRGIAGPVEMVLTLDAKGAVSGVKVLGAPDPLLERAAVRAARGFVFSPAEVDGKPAPVQIRYTYRFVLERTYSIRLPDWMLPERERPIGEAPLAGRVRETGTRLPLPAVAVAVLEAGVEVTTDEKGRFSVPAIAPGRYRVQAVSPRHERSIATAEVREGEQARVDFYLDPLTEDPYQTVVRGTRLQTAVTRVSLRQKELSTVPGTFGDPIRVVENLPGMARVPFGAGALLIRGASPEDSGVFLDGIRVPIIYHFLGGPSILNPQFLDRIDYHAGNADARFGRLVAGVVSVGTRSTFTDRLHGSVDVSLLNAGLFLNVPITKKVSVAVAGRRSYIDAILPAVVEATGESLLAVLPVYYDYQLRVDARLSENNSLAFLAFGSDDRMALADDAPTLGLDVAGRVTFHRLHGEWRARRGRLSSRFAPHVGFQLANMDYLSYGRDTEMTSVVGGAREDILVKLRPNILLRTGLDLELERRSFESLHGLPDLEGPAQVDELRGGVGVYLDAVIGFGKRLKVIPGARFDLVFFLDSVQPSTNPRLAVRYTLSEATTFKGAVGVFSQAPANLPIDRTSNEPRLYLEHAAHLSTGVEQRLLPALKLDLSGFFIYRWDMVPFSRILETAYEGIWGAAGFSNTGDGYAYGMELLLRHDVTERLYGWVSYTLSRSVSRTGPMAEYTRTVFDQTHILTLVASVRVGWGIETGVRYRLVSGNPITPVLDGYFHSDYGEHLPVHGPTRSEDRPLFHQLDLRVEKTWRFDWWRFGVYLDVLNVENAENPEMTFYDYRYRESGELRGIPILPTLGVKGSF
jgi:TonB family protein